MKPVYETEKYIQELNETAHNALYSMMFLVTSDANLDKICTLEQDLLEEARKAFPMRVANSLESKGGENGRIPFSEFYFIYACISIERI